MRKLAQQLDAILRGDATRVSALKEGRIDIRVREVGIAVIGAAVIAGACMGSFAVVRGGTDGLLQLLASAVKLPLLFILTLIVTFPSLYVFNALVGSRLTWESVLRLLVAANGVMLAVFASLGPIIVFFGLSTTSYPFMKLLNVLAATIGGVLGLAFLMRTLHRLVLVQEALDAARALEPAEAEPMEELEPVDESAADSEPAATSDETADESADSSSEPSGAAGGSRVGAFVRSRAGEGPKPPPSVADPFGALEPMDGPTPEKARAVFRVWVVVYAIVGAQMGWVLRPFIGAPGMEFSFFRDRESNFFLDFIETLQRLFGG